MDKQTAAVALQFLNRTQLTGGEVPAFLSVQQALTLILHAPEPVSQINGTAVDPHVLETTQ